MTSTSLITYWLIPAEPARKHFASLIAELATRFDGPVFEPHVTLYVTTAANDEPTRVIETVFAKMEPHRLFIAGIDFSDEFTKTLFVQFQSDRALTGLSETLKSASSAHGEYELNPHLSLLYKTMPPETQRQVAGSIDLPFSEVDFDSVQAVISPATIKCGEDVEAWRVVAERRLTR